MSHDPVTQSMLSEKDRTSFHTAPSGFDPPPDIDVLDLDQYTDDALSQVLVELRVRNERVEQEMQTVRQSILGFKTELQHRKTPAGHMTPKKILPVNYWKKPADSNRSPNTCNTILILTPTRETWKLTAIFISSKTAGKFTCLLNSEQ